MKQVLFLCSANYYRSRFAEHFFNWLAPQRNVSWRSDSRGLEVERWGDIGAISPYTIDALTERNIPINGNTRRPQQLAFEDLAKSALIIAVKESEHRMVTTRSGGARKRWVPSIPFSKSDASGTAWY